MADQSVPEVYVRLRELLDRQAFGFGKTAEGHEYEVLKRFFTEEEAALVLEMEPDRLFSAAEFAQRTGRSEEQAAQVLDALAMRGLIFRRRSDGEPMRYRVVPFAHGVIEFSIDRVLDDLETGNTAWLEHYLAWYTETWGKQWWGSSAVPFFRSVPIGKSVVEGGELLPYDDAEAIIRSKGRWAVGLCLCRVETAATGGYDDPRKETCMVFDEMANYYLDRGIAREITMQEALDLVRESVGMGYMIHVTNSQECEVMCSCDTRVCGLLQSMKAFGGPATKNESHYFVQVDKQRCLGDGGCVESCPCGAILIGGDGKSDYDPRLCVGCGQCVNACPKGARKLVIKPADELRELQPTLFQAYEEMEGLRRKAGQF